MCLQPVQFMLSGTTGALAVVALAILRIYLGWAYVGNRLLSAAVDYEESGWCASAREASGTLSRHAMGGESRQLVRQTETVTAHWTSARRHIAEPSCCKDALSLCLSLSLLSCLQV